MNIVTFRSWMLKRSKKFSTELNSSFRDASEQKSLLEWGALNAKLHKVLKSLKKYPKGTHPHTFDPVFLADAAKLANGFLVTSNTDHGYVDFSRRLTICKENKDVNEVLLNYATSIAIFKRYQDCLTLHLLVSLAGLICPTLCQIQRRPRKLWPSSDAQPSRPFREFLVN